MQRRKFLATVGSLAAGSAAAMGTGAFTSVEAERTVSIEVADDADALLGIDASNASNGDYMDTSGDQAILEITDKNDNFDGEGVNENATTVLRDLFDIHNQGANDVFVFIDFEPEDGDGPAPGFFADYPANVEPGEAEPQSGPGDPSTGLAKMGEGGEGTDGLPGDDDYEFSEGIEASKPARVFLEPGQSLREVGTVINTGEGFGTDAPIEGSATIGAISVDALGDDVSVDTTVGEDWEVEVSGFEA